MRTWGKMTKVESIRELEEWFFVENIHAFGFSHWAVEEVRSTDRTHRTKMTIISFYEAIFSCRRILNGFLYFIREFFLLLLLPFFLLILLLYCCDDDVTQNCKGGNEK